MKRSYSFLATAALCGLLLSSCGKKTDAAAGGDSSKSTSTTSTSASSNAPAGAKLTVKAAIAEGTMEYMGQKVQMKLYFDDYGTKSATETSGEMMGQKMHQMNITKDGYAWQLDLDKKTGSKHKASGKENFDFAHMSAEEMKAQGISESGNETLNGKECKVYTIDPAANTKQPAPKGAGDMKGKAWVWNGIPIKVEMGTMMKMEMTKIEESTPPSSIFDVPADIKVTDMADMPQGGVQTAPTEK